MEKINKLQSKSKKLRSNSSQRYIDANQFVKQVKRGDQTEIVEDEYSLRKRQANSVGSQLSGYDLMVQSRRNLFKTNFNTPKGGLGEKGGLVEEGGELKSFMEEYDMNLMKIDS